jgi:hypothetical protein
VWATLYVRPGNMHSALRQALRDADVDDLDVSRKLWFTYAGDGPATNGLNPPKEYTAEYVPSARQLQLALGDAVTPDKAPVA